MKHIYSTLTNDVTYNFHSFDSENNPHVEKSILVKGGTGIATPLLRRGGLPETLFGVKTSISDEDFDLLKEHKIFKNQVARGFIRTDSKSIDAEKVAGKMPLRDKSAPKTPDTDKEEGLPVAKFKA